MYGIGRMAVNMNNNLLLKAEKFLGELGIRTMRGERSLLVHKDILQFDDKQSILSQLNAECSTTKLFWGEETTDWLFLESF